MTPVTVFTSMTGHAEVDFTYGPLAGHQSVEATFPGYTGLPTVFSLHAVARLPGQPTRFAGIVQDNAVQPIGGAWVELDVAGARYQTFSDAQGRFAFSDIASGAGHLKVDASYAGTLGTNAIPTNTFHRFSTPFFWSRTRRTHCPVPCCCRGSTRTTSACTTARTTSC
jgi:hypothetical protein